VVKLVLQVPVTMQMMNDRESLSFSPSTKLKVLLGIFCLCRRKRAEEKSFKNIICYFLKYKRKKGISYVLYRGKKKKTSKL
jgi:hypothetical protein